MTTEISSLKRNRRGYRLAAHSVCEGWFLLLLTVLIRENSISERHESRNEERNGLSGSRRKQAENTAASMRLKHGEAIILASRSPRGGWRNSSLQSAIELMKA